MERKPDPKADDSYSEEETDRRTDATIRAMIAMGPQPRRTPGRAQELDTTRKKRVTPRKKR